MPTPRRGSSTRCARCSSRCRCPAAGDRPLASVSIHALKPALRQRLSLRSTRSREVAAVAGLFAVTAIFLAIEALRVKTYAWMADELVYTKAAQGFWSHPLHAHIFGEPYQVPNALYARVLALPYGLLSNLHAFSAAHAFNALAFASACVPVYLLARRLGATHLWGLVAAALAVWIPWSILTLVLLSESLAYPAFAWAVLAAVVAISEPRARNDVLLLVAMAVMVLARTQMFIVVPAFAAGLIAHELAWPERQPGELRARARAHWVLGAAIVVGLLVWLIFSPSLLGLYDRTAHYPRFPVNLLDAMANHLTHVVIGVGVVPAFLWVVAAVYGGSTPARREQHAFAYVSGLTALLLTYQAGFYAQQIAGGNLQERYLFYIVVLFAAGTAMVLSARPRRAATGTLLFAAALAVPIVGSANFRSGVTGVLTLESAASGFNDDINRLAFGSWTAAGTVAAIVALLAAVVAVVLFAGRWARYTYPALGAACVVFGLLLTVTVFGRVVPQVNAGTRTTLGTPPKAWVDGLLYQGSDDAGAIEGPLAGDSNGLWLWTEFWNSRLQRVYAPPGVSPVAGLSSTPLTVDPQTGRVTTATEMPALVVSAQDPRLRLRGREVRTIITGQRLITPVHPYQADLVFGSGGSTTVTPAPTQLALFPSKPGVGAAAVALTLVAPATPGANQPAPWTVTAGSRTFRGQLAAGARKTLTVTAPLDPGGRRAALTLAAPATRHAPPVTLGSVGVRWR
jgi:hypothetical protein